MYSKRNATVLYTNGAICNYMYGEMPGRWGLQVVIHTDATESFRILELYSLKMLGL